MRNPSSSATAAGTALAATGASAGLVHAIWLAVVCLIVGGSLITLAKLGPRVAVEPVRQPDGKHRLRLTWNGRPIRRPRR